MALFASWVFVAVTAFLIGRFSAPRPKEPVQPTIPYCAPTDSARGGERGG